MLRFRLRTAMVAVAIVATICSLLRLGRGQIVVVGGIIASTVLVTGYVAEKWRVTGCPATREEIIGLFLIIGLLIGALAILTGMVRGIL